MHQPAVASQRPEGGHLQGDHSQHQEGHQQDQGGREDRAKQKDQGGQEDMANQKDREDKANSKGPDRDIVVPKQTSMVSTIPPLKHCPESQKYVVRLLVLRTRTVRRISLGCGGRLIGRNRRSRTRTKLWRESGLVIRMRHNEKNRQRV